MEGHCVTAGGGVLGTPSDAPLVEAITGVALMNVVRISFPGLDQNQLQKVPWRAALLPYYGLRSTAHVTLTEPCQSPSVGKLLPGMRQLSSYRLAPDALQVI